MLFFLPGLLTMWYQFWPPDFLSWLAKHLPLHAMSIEKSHYLPQKQSIFNDVLAFDVYFDIKICVGHWFTIFFLQKKRYLSLVFISFLTGARSGILARRQCTPYTRWYNRIFTSKSWYKIQRHVRGWTGVSWRCFDVYRQYQEELWAETLRRIKVYLPLFFAISSLL